MNHSSPKSLSKKPINTQSGYDLWSKQYDANESHTVQTARKALLDLLPKLEGARVLEIGCGTGANLKNLESSGVAHAYGIDFSSGILHKAKSKSYKYPIDFIQHDITKPLPIPSKSIDCVLMCLVLEHLDCPAVIFDEITRVLKPNGQSIIVELHPFQALQQKFAHFQSDDHDCEYHMTSTAHSFSDILNAHLKSGLKLDKVEEYLSVKDRRPTQAPFLLGILARRTAE